MDTIRIRGARTHNLKNIDVEIPREALTVITGVSGSGKSSLAFDTVFAEGQRKYMESLSAYARQFIGQMDKPRYDMIRGLSPTISIDQKAASRNPRSTVGTITETYDVLRLLYTHIGEVHCPNGHGPAAAATPEEKALVIKRFSSFYYLRERYDDAELMRKNVAALFAGMMTMCPAVTRSSSPPIVRSASPSVTRTVASYGDVCSLRLWPAISSIA